MFFKSPKSVKFQISISGSLLQVIQKSIDEYNSRFTSRGSLYYASWDSPHDFLKRITINYLRHECTVFPDLVFFGHEPKYDICCKIVARQFGINGYKIFKEKINEKICADFSLRIEQLLKTKHR